MTKIEEILSETFRLVNMDGSYCEPEIELLRDAISTGVDYETLISCIQTYAEFYAKKCLKLADYQINATEEIVHPTELTLPKHD